jgi:hypothetical protein
MSSQADVKSLDTLSFVKAALASYAHETGQAIAEVELEGRRAVDYITVDMAAHWKAEVRRCNDLVNHAIKDLEHCKAFKKVGDNTPSCIEEKKALAKAKARLEQAERKAEAVRRWTPVVLQQFREACVRLVRFREVIDTDCPRAAAHLERMLQALEAYRAAPSPQGTAGAAASAAPAMTRQVADDPQATAATAPATDGGKEGT